MLHPPNGPDRSGSGRAEEVTDEQGAGGSGSLLTKDGQTTAAGEEIEEEFIDAEISIEGFGGAEAAKVINDGLESA